MNKVFLFPHDRVFSEKIKKTFSDNLKLSYENNTSNVDTIKKALYGDADFVFLDWDHIHYLRSMTPKAKVVVFSDKYDLKKEYLSARLGAKGFITKDIEVPYLKRGIDIVKYGQIWMTREVTKMVFEEYSKMIKKSSKVYLEQLMHHIYNNSSLYK